MNRRTLLAMVGAATGIGASGCIDQTEGAVAGDDDPALPDGLEVETLYEQGDVLEGEYHTMEHEEEHHVLIEDSETAEEKIDAGESVASFVADTDFGESCLLVAQNGMQSSPDLSVTAVERGDGKLRVRISVDPPDHDLEDDIATYSLLVRITDDKGDVPNTVTVDLEGYV